MCRFLSSTKVDKVFMHVDFSNSTESKACFIAHCNYTFKRIHKPFKWFKNIYIWRSNPLIMSCSCIFAQFKIYWCYNDIIAVSPCSQCLQRHIRGIPALTSTCSQINGPILLVTYLLSGRYAKIRNKTITKATTNWTLGRWILEKMLYRRGIFLLIFLFLTDGKYTILGVWQLIQSTK